MRDYVSSFESATRNTNTINTIRGWQIAAVVGFPVFTRSLPLPLAVVLAVFVWGALLVLECNEQLFLECANDHIERCERRLHAATADEWRAVVRDWTYGGEEVHKAIHHRRWPAVLQVAKKNGVLPGQVIVLIALLGGLLLRSYLSIPGKP